MVSQGGNYFIEVLTVSCSQYAVWSMVNLCVYNSFAMITKKGILGLSLTPLLIGAFNLSRDLRVALVFACGSALWERSSFCFSSIFC